MKVEITKAQLKAIESLKDDIDSMIGCSENDQVWIKNVRLINRFLNKNQK